MTPTTAAEKVKEIVKSWDIYAYGPVWDEMEEEKVKEWLATEEGSRLVGELVEGWVSVEDNKPPKEKWVLLYNGHWVGVGKLRKKNYDDEPDWCDETSEWIAIDPTHWQPLPNPPKIN